MYNFIKMMYIFCNMSTNYLKLNQRHEKRLVSLLILIILSLYGIPFNRFQNEKKDEKKKCILTLDIYYTINEVNIYLTRNKKNHNKFSL